MGRTIFIGDVHGCYTELMALLAKLHATDDDVLYFVGDLIDKGPQSLEVLEYVRARPHTYAVAGNHEYYKTLSERDMSTLSEEGQDEARGDRKSYGAFQLELERLGWIDYFRTLPTYIETDDFIVVHAGIHPELGLTAPAEITTNIRVWKGKPWYSYYTGKKKVFYGHWAANGLHIENNTYGLDTGCAYGGHLTAYVLETAEICQYRADRLHAIPKHWGGI